jgi:hypothetical protein
MKKIKSVIASPYFITSLFVFKMMVYYSLIEVHRLEIVMIILSLVRMGSNIYSVWTKQNEKEERDIPDGILPSQLTDVC